MVCRLGMGKELGKIRPEHGRQVRKFSTGLKRRDGLSEMKAGAGDGNGEKLLT